MSGKTTPTARDLRMLRFEVISDNEKNNKPLCAGNYKEVLGYLKHHELDGLAVMAVDVDSWSSMDPIPAESFMKWYKLIVVPQLKDAKYIEDTDVYFPNEHLQLAEGKT